MTDRRVQRHRAEVVIGGHRLQAQLAGGACGQLETGRHVRYPENTPFMNLCVTLLAKVDVMVDKLGDSTGMLTGL